MVQTVRLKELRTLACFPLFKQRGINYPPAASRMGPLSLQKGASFCRLSFLLASVFLLFHTAEDVQHITFIPSDSHSGFYFPPTSVGPPFSPERETFCVLSFHTTFGFLLFIGKLSFCRCSKPICQPLTSDLLSPTCLFSLIACIQQAVYLYIKKLFAESTPCAPFLVIHIIHITGTSTVSAFQGSIAVF